MTDASPSHRSGLIDAVFLTFDARETALECVAHLREPEIASVVVVDNASTDGTSAAIREAHPDVTVITLDAPTGLAAGLNLAAARGQAPFVLYLNDDAFAQAGSIRLLLDTLLRRHDAVAAGGRLVDPGDLRTQDRYRPQPFPTPATIVARLFGLERLWPRNPWTGKHLRRMLDDDTTVEVDQPAGACMLVRRPVAERVGGWDERYWFWYEDVDFSRRLARHGAQLYVPTAPFRHVGGATARRLDVAAGHARYYYGALQYARTHFSRAGRAGVAVAMLAVSLGRAALSLRRDPASVSIYLGASRGALRLAAGREIRRL